MARILCIEDSQEFQIYLTSLLREHSLLHANSIQEAHGFLKSQPENIDLILLDISLPDGSGMDLLPQVKEILGQRHVPCIIISSNSDVYTKVAAFGIGADDYICKPPDPHELKARIDAKVRWSAESSVRSSYLTYEDLLIDTDKVSVEVAKKGQEKVRLELTPIEYKILKLLITRPGQVYSRDQIINNVWGVGKYLTERTVDAHVSHLRKKISDSSVKIETVLSLGYKLTI
jgi:DNA-binding response OmpR family regulator